MEVNSIFPRYSECTEASQFFDAVEEKKAIKCLSARYAVALETATKLQI